FGQTVLWGGRWLPPSFLGRLGGGEVAPSRRPSANPGGAGPPPLSWPRQIPIAGAPADVVRIVEDYGRYLAQSPLPKLFINAEPGSILVGRQREVCRGWPNQSEVTIKGLHFVQEDSPNEIGAALAAFVRRLRGG